MSSRVATVRRDNSLLPWLASCDAYSIEQCVSFPSRVKFTAAPTVAAKPIEIHSHHSLQGETRFPFLMRDAVGGVFQPFVEKIEEDVTASGLTKKSQLSATDQLAYEKLLRLFKAEGKSVSRGGEDMQLAPVTCANPTDYEGDAEIDEAIAFASSVLDSLS